MISIEPPDAGYLADSKDGEQIMTGAVHKIKFRFYEFVGELIKVSD